MQATLRPCSGLVLGQLAPESVQQQARSAGPNTSMSFLAKPICIRPHGHVGRRSIDLHSKLADIPSDPK